MSLPMCIGVATNEVGQLRVAACGVAVAAWRMQIASYGGGVTLPLAPLSRRATAVNPACSQGHGRAVLP